MPESKQVVMLASEDDALIGGKVGGVGDVVRDLPAALAAHGWSTTVLLPSYGFLHARNPSRQVGDVSFPFAGAQQTATIFEVTPKRPVAGVRHLVFEHPLLRGEPVYYNDPPEETFSRDASKFALFSSAAGQFLRSVDRSTVVHVHDWHPAFLFLLEHLHPAFAHVRMFRTVFTIHNLGIQGSRPIARSASSVKAWFPELFGDTSWLSSWRDRRYDEDTFTPMAAGILCADAINTVSPSYAGEILQPSDHERGIYGGEGLEDLLRPLQREGRLSGILNGIEYPSPQQQNAPAWNDLVALMRAECSGDASVRAVNRLALDRLTRLTRPKVLLTSITRVVEQKMRMLFEKGRAGTSALDGILNMLEEVDGLYCIVGTGIEEYESLLAEAARRTPRLLFINRYSPALSDALFACGTLFLMPSLYEPCGISQMVAMRAGQPCLVHAVGGLNDTVLEGVNGFRFAGADFPSKADNFVAAARAALKIALTDPAGWERIRSNARSARFAWEESASRYITDLYAPAARGTPR